MMDLRMNWTPSPTKALTALDHVANIIPPTRTMRELRVCLTLYEADLRSLRTYGRPIYGENWRASWHGPRGDVATALLTRDPVVVGMLDSATAEAMRAGKTGLEGLPRMDGDLLSVSDVECLHEAIEDVEEVGDADLVLHYATLAEVIEAQGGVIWPVDMTRSELDEEHVRDIEGSMPHIVF